ncbi:MAG: purine NTP phosphatase [Melioribacteraceae bacterium]|nr:MAG: purine NTP phosphatase [Melioribacteraceae bacterium]
MRIYVGSLNPVKINAVKVAFQSVWGNLSIVGVNSSSGVPDQPFDEDTFTGARNRVMDIIGRTEFDEKDLAVGIEGGIFHIYNRFIAKGIVCIGDKSGKIGFGESAGFELPQKVMNKIYEGNELGVVIDNLTGENETKKKGGAIGHLTGNLIDRTELYRMGIITAAVPFFNRKLYFKENMGEE